MKKILTSVLLILCIALQAQDKAKYVFFFIGDGMGVNQVNTAETYLAAIEGKIGIKELCMSSFPYSALVNTQSESNGVTDSAAGGTALATGHKTRNGALGMLADKKTAVSSIAQWAHEKGAAVGITTSVTIDHATPAAFYAHVPSRKQNYDIGKQMIESKFDFFAGSALSKPQNPDSGKPNLYQQAEQAGYTIAKGYADYQAKAPKAGKMILMQTDEANSKSSRSIPYAIDRSVDDLTLPQITQAATDFLMRKQDKKNGFFLMVEGGKIDWACHPNDAATFIHELIDMDNAVRVAYDFYKQHPDSTLIVITADHETGGLVLGTGSYELHLERLKHQTMSIEKLGTELARLRQENKKDYDFETVKEFLSQNFGLWSSITLIDEQEDAIEQAFENIKKGKGKDTQTLYQKDNELATAVKKIMSEAAHLSWASGGHSNGYVPVYAVGAGANLFNGRIDNTEIPKRIAKAAGW